MFEMCDKVRIKDLGVTGEVIDVGDNYGVPYYLVETDDDFDGEDPRQEHIGRYEDEQRFLHSG